MIFCSKCNIKMQHVKTNLVWNNLVVNRQDEYKCNICQAVGINLSCEQDGGKVVDHFRGGKFFKRRDGDE